MQNGQIFYFGYFRVTHVEKSIKLHFNRKKLRFNTRIAFRSTDATAYNATFFNISFCYLLSAKN